MKSLTDKGRAVVADLAARYRLSQDAVSAMLDAVDRGQGSMAQFYVPELGGNGQWMRGGMTMVGDMFNHGLKATVDNLCNELSQALASGDLFAWPVQGAHQGGGYQSASWWPSDLGVPSSTGGQNDSAYAVFPSSRRLAISSGGQVTLYDTLDHQIGGVSQQQGSSASLTFSSQFGQFAVSSLPLAGNPVPGQRDTAPADTPSDIAPAASEFPAPEPYFVEPAISSSPAAAMPSVDADQIIGLIQKLGALRDAGLLTGDEYQAKKTELLGRL